MQKDRRATFTGIDCIVDITGSEPRFQHLDCVRCDNGHRNCHSYATDAILHRGHYYRYLLTKACRVRPNVLIILKIIEASMIMKTGEHENVLLFII